MCSKMALAANTNDIYFFDRVANEYDGDRKKAGRELVDVLSDSKSRNLNQCVAAYFLGELRYADSVQVLVDHITLRVDASKIQMKYRVSLDKLSDPAVNALIKIGTFAIPRLVQQLQESDDAEARDLSLKAILKIEDNKDIVQLRLKTALDAQSDSTKKARVQSAIRALSELPSLK